MVFLGRPTLIGSPRRSQLGIAGAVVASIIQAAVAVTMATAQIIYQEYSERRARKQWERDQRSRAAELERKTQELETQNRELQDYLSTVTGGGTAAGGAPATTADSFLGSPWLPYVVIGGIAAVVFLKRRD